MAGGKGLDSYLRAHEQAAARQLASMREETTRFDALEALGPVEAGLRELLDLHGNPADLVLDREGDALILRSPKDRVEVFWALRAATIAIRGKSRNIHGNGHWQVAVNGELPELFAELAPLMGHLATLVRAMVRGRPLTAEAPVAVKRKPPGPESPL